MGQVRVSAPGKIILMGEHAAVYGRPALVAAIDRRLFVELADRDDGDVRLDLPQIGVSETTTWDEVRAYAGAARERWHEYERDPGPEAFRRLRGADPAHLVRVALGEAAARFEDDAGVDLRLDSQIPIGAGFGSSAAAAAAVVVAILELRGMRLPDRDLRRLTLEVERRQHGLPSGVDNATVIHGGLVWAERAADGELVATPLEIRSPVLQSVRVFNSGEPAETTGDVVAAVRSRFEADPAGVGALLDRMEAATRELRDLLAGTVDETDPVVTLLREFETCLEGIGVVPEAVRAIVRQVETHGGGAKISGAGALTGRGAGSLLVAHPRPREIDGWGFLDSLERLDLRLGAGGVGIDEAA